MEALALKKKYRKLSVQREYKKLSLFSLKTPRGKEVKETT
jgi:hypothetical protein